MKSLKELSIDKNYNILEDEKSVDRTAKVGSFDSTF